MGFQVGDWVTFTDDAKTRVWYLEASFSSGKSYRVDGVPLDGYVSVTDDAGIPYRIDAHHVQLARSPEESPVKSALDTQVGGDHYRKMRIQPVEFIHANDIPFIEGCIIKYAARWRDKGGLKDLEKIIHFSQILIDLEKKRLAGIES